MCICHGRISRSCTAFQCAIWLQTVSKQPPEPVFPWLPDCWTAAWHVPLLHPMFPQTLLSSSKHHQLWTVLCQNWEIGLCKDGNNNNNLYFLLSATSHMIHFAVTLFTTKIWLVQPIYLFTFRHCDPGHGLVQYNFHYLWPTLIIHY